MGGARESTAGNNHAAGSDESDAAWRMSCQVCLRVAKISSRNRRRAAACARARRRPRPARCEARATHARTTRNLSKFNWKREGRTLIRGARKLVVFHCGACSLAEERDAKCPPLARFAAAAATAAAAAPAVAAEEERAHCPCSNGQNRAKTSAPRSQPGGPLLASRHRPGFQAQGRLYG